MNILLISHYAGAPSIGMVFRHYYLAKEWQKLGCAVKILTASYTHLRKKNFNVNKDFQEYTIDGVEYVFIKTPRYSSLIGRAMNILAFAFKLRVNTKQIAEKYHPDVVISSSTYNFDVYSAVKIAHFANAKLVYEVRDLWPLTPIELGGYSKYNPLIMLMQHAENTAYKKADFVISVLPCVHDYMKSHGLDLKKLSIIPNGIYESDWDSPSLSASPFVTALSEFLTEKKKQGYTMIGYTGAFGNANALEYLLSAADILRNIKIIFVLIGSGIEKEALIAMKEKLNVKNVYFFDSITKTLIPSILNYFDVLYIGWRDVDIYRFGISANKLMDYMMSGKPILHSVSAGNDPVSEARCGITVEPENPNAIADGIMELVNMPENVRIEMGKRGRDYILKNNTYSVLAKKFLNAISG